MFLNPNENYPLEYGEEADVCIAEFLSGRHLVSVTKPEKKQRKEHDQKYQKIVKKEEKLVKTSQNSRIVGSRKYREEVYNKQSKCDAQFINNYHTYKTCDAGSGYNATQKHYASDFVLSNTCDDDEVTKILKNLPVSSKKEAAKEWIGKHCNPTRLHRSFSCPPNTRFPSNDEEDRNRKEYAARRREWINFSSSISDIDPTYIPDNCFYLDTSRLLREISLSFKRMISRVNSQKHRVGELKIKKVLFSTEDLYAYVIPEEFNAQKALVYFSTEFKNWHDALPEERQKLLGIDERLGWVHCRINVVIFLAEFEEEKTQYRRARHICRLPNDNYEQRDLYVELDTGEFRVFETTMETVRQLPEQWAFIPTPILEVRFRGAKTELDVKKRIESIRRTKRAMIESFDYGEKKRTKNGKIKSFKGQRFWNEADTAVLHVYKEYCEPRQTTLFCGEKDCRGLCETEEYFKIPTPVELEPPCVDKLSQLRQTFFSEKVLAYTSNRPLAAYVLPNTDAHQNDRVPEYYSRVKYLSGFTGICGFTVITHDSAILWADNQHFKFAQKEVDATHWTIKNLNDDHVVDWLIQELPRGCVIGFDPSLVTFSGYLNSCRQLKGHGLELIAIPGNLVDDIWKTRPFREGDAVKLLSLDECGITPCMKFEELRKELQVRKCSAAVISSLDDVMWLLNFRGNDIPFSHLTYSYLFVTATETHLFIDLEKLDKPAKAHLNRLNINFHPYRNVHSFMADWLEKKRAINENQMIFLSPDTNYSIGSIFGEHYSIIDGSIVKKIKATKNPREMKGMRESSLRDSVAIVEFLCWIESEMREAKLHTEVEYVEKLEQIKSRHEKYVQQSLPTIFSSGTHAAKLHHEPDAHHHVSHNHQFLLQSGGHYKYGTTNTSRTSWFINPTEEFMNQFTVILKGHIQVASAQFPETLTCGSRLDVLARKALWEAGLDFPHDAGHGVGHFLDIRETHIVIGHGENSSDGRIEAGQVITLEPGYYEEGKYGIRIGGCYETVSIASNEQRFLSFKPLTLVPIQTSIISRNLLTPEEILWLNKYHYQVFAQIGMILRDENKKKEYDWLLEACKPI